MLQATAEDVRLLPLVSGKGKGERLMLTMGVTRALGDFDLVHRPSQINMKAFVSPHPDVQVWPAYKEQPSNGDYLVMATDGLWDVVTNEEVKVFLFILMNHSGWKILDVCKGRGTYELSIAADQGFLASPVKSSNLRFIQWQPFCFCLVLAGKRLSRAGPGGEKGGILGEGGWTTCFWRRHFRLCNSP